MSRDIRLQSLRHSQGIPSLEAPTVTQEAWSDIHLSPTPLVQYSPLKQLLLPLTSFSLWGFLGQISLCELLSSTSPGSNQRIHPLTDLKFSLPNKTNSFPRKR